MMMTYEGVLKSLYNDIISAVDDIFWSVESKHCNIDGRNVWIT